ncbi:MAG: diaminopimelate dehydrogenase [Paludibacteraceae bacterium]|nr:diaminopimelate dehydrogenase [Paludibacteraceae bacterium]
MRVVIVGYGNIGKAAIDAVLASNDMQLAGVVSRRAESLKEELGKRNIQVVSELDDLDKVDVALLALPTRQVPQAAQQLLQKGISTVDSYDIHGGIADLRKQLDPIAKQSGAVSIISAGWDPGTDSVVRCLMQAMAPKGITYTNFGPGRSMGHSVAAKAVKGVKDALSITIPLGTSIHRRMVYVETEEGADFEQIKQDILADDYFKHDETHVYKVDSVADLNDVGHAVLMERKGVSGNTHNQLFKFQMHINNPALTAQIMVASARAAMKMPSGAYTLIQVPPIYLLEGDQEQLIKQLV